VHWWRTYPFYLAGVSPTLRLVKQGRDSDLAQLKEHLENAEKSTNNLME
jgi:hypothetical protein